MRLFQVWYDEGVDVLHERVTMFASFWMCAKVPEPGKSIRSWEFARCGIYLVAPNRTWVRIAPAVTVSVVQHVARRKKPGSSRSMGDLTKCGSSAVCEIFPKSTSSSSLTALTRPRSRLDSLSVPKHLEHSTLHAAYLRTTGSADLWVLPVFISAPHSRPRWQATDGHQISSE